MPERGESGRKASGKGATSRCHQLNFRALPTLKSHGPGNCFATPQKERQSGIPAIFFGIFAISPGSAEGYVGVVRIIRRQRLDPPRSRGLFLPPFDYLVASPAGPIRIRIGVGSAPANQIRTSIAKAGLMSFMRYRG